MLNILADALLIALRMGSATPDRSRDFRKPEPSQRRKPADQRF